eukprot:CAMPEP_0184690120 /NCGR_PEP_ID=MMETSP0312-20130426/31042_1 /TAXON_ID=31354 /ORGANISM="Compsopogon coeruleus, Strain SAG 36.94" /LENGTH=706 /DNA_ID=CAMNT_0027147561 /DNA_START=54 /DNA_END=2171 /DNA_ORIENTATION=-
MEMWRRLGGVWLVVCVVWACHGARVDLHRRVPFSAEVEVEIRNVESPIPWLRRVVRPDSVNHETGEIEFEIPQDVRRLVEESPLKIDLRVIVSVGNEVVQEFPLHQLLDAERPRSDWKTKASQPEGRETHEEFPVREDLAMAAEESPHGPSNEEENNAVGGDTDAPDPFEEIHLLLERGTVRDAVRELEAKRMSSSSPHHASTFLGLLYLAGKGRMFPPDRRRAMELLSEAAHHGDPDAQAILGFLYASGFDPSMVPRDKARAILLWTFAAVEGGSIYAQIAMGFRHLHGIDVKKNCQKAAHYYELAARTVVKEKSRPRYIERHFDEPVILSEEHSTMTRTEHEELVEYFKREAERGDVVSQLNIGEVYYHGAFGVRQDPLEARKLFEKAAEKGLPRAHSHLGYMYLNGLGGLDQNNKSAAKHFKIAADQKDGPGLKGMGYMKLHGIEFAKSEAEAAEYFHEAAKLSKPEREAMYNLGIMYEKGTGVPRDLNKANQYLNAAANYLHAHAMLRVGSSLKKDNCKRSCFLLKRVAEQAALKRSLVTGLAAYEDQDESAALFWYMFAAFAGYRAAQYNAAFLLEKGYGVTHALESSGADMAMDIYQWSARQGNVQSLVRVGDLMYDIRKDFEKAAQMYRQASSKKNAEATFNLGVMYFLGKGVPLDLEMSKRFFEECMELSDQSAKEAYVPSLLALFFLRNFVSLRDRW